MKIYIAGPMTGYTDFNKPAFYEAEQKLLAKGLTVLNPAMTPLGLTPAQYMDIDLSMVRACDAIYMLKGWENSPGATCERSYARFLNLKILYEGDI